MLRRLPPITTPHRRPPPLTLHHNTAISFHPPPTTPRRPPPLTSCYNIRLLKSTPATASHFLSTFLQLPPFPTTCHHLTPPTTGFHHLEALVTFDHHHLPSPAATSYNLPLLLNCHILPPVPLVASNHISPHTFTSRFLPHITSTFQPLILSIPFVSPRGWSVAGELGLIPSCTVTPLISQAISGR